MVCLFCVVAGIVIIAVLLKIYVRVTLGVCTSNARLNGKTVIVTGANTGIGFETAKDLARRGARVILACRDMTKAEKAKDAIVASVINPDVVVKKLDLSSLKSVNEFADDILKNEQRLNILINNAGMSGTSEKTITEDGLEYQMATNHFGHFLLTNRLLDLLKKSGSSRIINVSSTMHYFGRLGDLSNLNAEKSFDHKLKIYGRSKLANVLFTRELAYRLYGTEVTVNSLCPGAVITELGRSDPKVFKWLWDNVFSYLRKSAQEGAQTTIHLAVSEEIEGISGKHFKDCKLASISYEAYDITLARKLWDVSTKLVGLVK